MLTENLIEGNLVNPNEGGKLYMDNDSENEIAANEVIDLENTVNSEDQPFSSQKQVGLCLNETKSSTASVFQDAPNQAFELPFSQALQHLIQASKNTVTVDNQFNENIARSPVPEIQQDLNTDPDIMQLLEQTIETQRSKFVENMRKGPLPMVENTFGAETQLESSQVGLCSKKFTCPVCIRPFGRRYANVFELKKH